MIETAIALGVLAGVAAMIAQLATWAIQQRSRMDARQEAAEIAANELEAAQALPWESLTPAWAETRTVPSYGLDQHPGTALTVRVEAEPERPRVKRVTVQVRWTSGEKKAWIPTTMTALFAARSPGGER